MNDPEIELVVVCTTQHFHYQYAKMALDHGKHVMVEKPFTMTLQEAKDIFAYAREKGLLCQCFQNRRYDSDFLTVQKVIESGKLGDLLEVEITLTIIDLKSQNLCMILHSMMGIYMDMDVTQ